MKWLWLVLVLGLAWPAMAAEPLLMPGKQTLYQRVLTRPGAALVPQPGATDGTVQTPFSVFYVYDRRTVGGQSWVAVGATAQGTVDGWLPADGVIDWKQTMVLAFTNPAGRARTLFFDERAPLVDLLEADDRDQRATELVEAAAQSGPTPPEVVAIEPATHVDIDNQFYLLPILEAEEAYLDSGFPLRLVEIASLPLETDPTPAPSQAEPFTAAVVFVIDATTSMGPYIDRTRQAVKTIYERIEAAGLGGRVRFGLVAFRDHLGKDPGIEFVSRLFVDPNEAETRRDFFARVDDLAPARVSTTGFVEDAYAGLLTAIDRIDWQDFGGRYVVLITDAGARDLDDPLSTTGLDARLVRRLAEDQGIAIFALHLQTPAGRGDHAQAEAQYRALTSYAGLPPLYFPVAAGTVQTFGAVVEALADTVVDDVAAASTGASALPKPAAAAPTSVAGQAAQAAAQVGHAMRLAWLGRVQGTQAPEVFRAWATDRDPTQPDRATFDVRVLLTRDQLSDLQQALRHIVDAARTGQLSPGDFFDQLRSAALAMGRDPGRIGTAQARNLAETGLMGEYLEGLPYRSKVMNIDQDLWTSWSIGQQQAFIDELQAKMRLYQRYHDDTDKWIALDRGRVPGDAVYPVPLEALP